MICLPHGQMSNGAKAVNNGSFPPKDKENPRQKLQGTDMEKKSRQTNPWTSEENSRRGIGGG